MRHTSIPDTRITKISLSVQVSDIFATARIGLSDKQERIGGCNEAPTSICPHQFSTAFYRSVLLNPKFQDNKVSYQCRYEDNITKLSVR